MPSAPDAYESFASSAALPDPTMVHSPPAVEGAASHPEGWAGLPADILLLVLSHATPDSHKAARATCSAWCAAVDCLPWHTARADLRNPNLGPLPRTCMRSMHLHRVELTFNGSFTMVSELTGGPDRAAFVKALARLQLPQFTQLRSISYRGRTQDSAGPSMPVLVLHLGNYCVHASTVEALMYEADPLLLSCWPSLEVYATALPSAWPGQSCRAGLILDGGLSSHLIQTGNVIGIQAASPRGRPPATGQAAPWDDVCPQGGQESVSGKAQFGVGYSKGSAAAGQTAPWDDACSGACQEAGSKVPSGVGNGRRNATAGQTAPWDKVSGATPWVGGQALGSRTSAGGLRRRSVEGLGSGGVYRRLLRCCLPARGTTLSLAPASRPGVAPMARHGSWVSSWSAAEGHDAAAQLAAAAPGLRVLQLAGPAASQGLGVRAGALLRPEHVAFCCMPLSVEEVEFVGAEMPRVYHSSTHFKPWEAVLLVDTPDYLLQHFVKPLAAAFPHLRSVRCLATHVPSGSVTPTPPQGVTRTLVSAAWPLPAAGPAMRSRGGDAGGATGAAMTGSTSPQAGLARDAAGASSREGSGHARSTRQLGRASDAPEAAPAGAPNGLWTFNWAGAETRRAAGTSVIQQVWRVWASASGLEDEVFEATDGLRVQQCDVIFEREE